MSAEEKINTPQRVLLATMPKSGLWYLICLFWTYNEALKGKIPDLQGALKGSLNDASPLLDALGLGVLDTVHCIAPGYAEENDPQYPVWRDLDLEFYSGVYDAGREIAHTYHNPRNNKNAKIIYVYRNPLDQFLSMFNHLQHHSQHSFRYMKKDGKDVLIKSLNEFIFEAAGLNSYIKQFHTFMFMKKYYPHNILMITYEDLLKNPKKQIKKMLSFMENPVTTQVQRKALSVALNATKFNSMKEIEKKLGHSLGEPPHPEQQSHMKSGKIGNWKNHISQDEVKMIEERLNEFGYSLKEFTISIDQFAFLKKSIHNFLQSLFFKSIRN